MNSPVCRACGAKTTLDDTGVIGNGIVRLVSCPQCATVLVGVKPDGEELSRIYHKLFEKGNYGGLDGKVVRIAGRRFQPVWSYLLWRIGRLVQGRRMIEIGGGMPSQSSPGEHLHIVACQTRVSESKCSAK